MKRAGAPIAVIGSAAGFALVTVLVFLARTGEPAATNWPVNWQLRSSDNGVLFQLMQDIFSGRALDWSFSPQVYIFPEIPISFLAYVFAGGSIYLYYVIVAAINNTLLFLAILGVLRLMFPAARLASLLARTSLAATPLVLFPLIGTSWIISYALAPTYYYGMYLVLLGAPALLLVRRRWVRICLMLGIGLASASNPLLLVFALPAFGITLLLFASKRGMRAALRLAIAPAITLVFAALVRMLVFTPLQGTSPLTYMDMELFQQRRAQIAPYFAALSQDASTRVILQVGAVLAGVCLFAAIVVAVGYLQRTGPFGDRMLVYVYFGLVPLLGLAATAALLITSYLYFWPVLIAPFVFVLMAIPGRWAAQLLAPAAVTLLVVALLSAPPPPPLLADPNAKPPLQYFGYRSPETQCIDEGLPAGVTVGYATFSDARRLSLTSQTPFRLIQLLSNGEPAFWLTNRNYVRDEVGQFFYVNGHGDEAEIDPAFITGTFGQPDKQFSCGDDQTVFVYTAPEKLAAIADFYGVRSR